MATDATPVVVSPELDQLEGLAAAMAATRHAARAEATRRGYASDWARFEDWCARHGARALPASPLTVEAYLAAADEERRHRGGDPYAPATLRRWVAAINHVHSSANEPAPGTTQQVKDALDGIARRRAGAGFQTHQVEPLSITHLSTISAAIAADATWPACVRSLRDRAVLLAGFGGAFRRSELAALTLGDATLRPDGLHLRVRRSKTDQHAEGLVKGIPAAGDPFLCAPCAVRRWTTFLQVADNHDLPGVLAHLMTPGALHPGSTPAGTDNPAPASDGHICRQRAAVGGDPSRPLFRSLDRHGNVSGRALTGHAVGAIVKHWVLRVGLDPDVYAGHSLRAGFVTEAARGQATVLEICHQTGHRSPATVQKYLRERDPMATNAATKLPW